MYTTIYIILVYYVDLCRHYIPRYIIKFQFFISYTKLHIHGQYYIDFILLPFQFIKIKDIHSF